MCMSPKIIKTPETNLGIFSNWKRFIEVPCGKCEECRSSKADEWGFRCMCEWLAYPKEFREDDCWFLTLTYDDIHNPGLVNPEHMDKFIRSIRKKGMKIRYFYCGEYGSKTLRPHYHMIVYGLHLDDLVYYGKSKKSGEKLYMSAFIQGLWKRGNVQIGRLTLASARYTAQYSLKKNLTDCYQRMSQGIGKQYFLDNMKQIISEGCVSVPNGIGGVSKHGIPRYFKKLYRKIVGEDKYRKWICYYLKKCAEYQLHKYDKFKEVEDIPYIMRLSLGCSSNKQKRAARDRAYISRKRRELLLARDYE